MGKLGTGRNNQLSQNGLLYDSDGNVFDLTEWYKDNSLSTTESHLALLSEVLCELKLIKTHLSLMTDEELLENDIEDN
tara:strand:+ start:77 stop:310 length:234 start_codon:yes stop_codon:yes gene_type:complete